MRELRLFDSLTFSTSSGVSLAKDPHRLEIEFGRGFGSFLGGLMLLVWNLGSMVVSDIANIASFQATQAD